MSSGSTLLPVRAAHSCRRRALLAGALLLPLAAPGRAAAWPERPIRVIVPYTPAGATDLVTRMLVERLGAATGWTFVVENRPGASGNLGLDLVAKAHGDRHLLAMGQTSNLAINPTLIASMPYDALRDVTPIARVAAQPVVVVVRAESPHRSLADVVAAARAQPGRVTLASAGNGTVGHLAGELFAQRAGVTVQHVPYKGAAPALTDLIGGQVDMMLPTPQAALQLVRAGRLRALAVTSARRLPVLPDVPTVAESGHAGFEALDWKMLVGPADLPAEIVAKLNAATQQVLGRAEAMARLAEDGSAAMSGSAEDAAMFLKAEHARWGRIVRDAHVRAE